jgi:plastocyanin
VKGDLIAYTVMETRAGWGTEYPAELRNGEWEYAAFGPDTKLNEKANYKACFQCHKPHEATDFVISQTKLAATGAAVAAKAGDVSIVGFTFGPAKLSVDAGRLVVWTNADDSPHQITFTRTQQRSPVLAKGQSHSVKFDAPGAYDYICGLHPQMKGVVEVK